MTIYQSPWQRLLHSALARIIVGLALCIFILTVVQIGIDKLLGLLSLNHASKSMIKGFIISALIVTAYIQLYKRYERRKITEFSDQGLAKNLIIGILIGAVLQSLTIYVIYLNGWFSVLSVNSLVSILPSLAVSFTAAIIEETLLRGIIFRITEEKLGSYIALAISAAIFGALHLANQNSSLASGAAIAIEAGLLLGAAYMYSRNLWFPIAIHFAWNFTQSGIYGAATSGNPVTESLLTTSIHGNPHITGGLFGPEGSIQAILFCSIATILLLIACHRQHKILQRAR